MTAHAVTHPRYESPLIWLISLALTLATLTFVDAAFPPAAPGVARDLSPCLAWQGACGVLVTVSTQGNHHG